MIKVSRRNMRVLLFIALFTAACSFAIGINLSANNGTKRSSATSFSGSGQTKETVTGDLPKDNSAPKVVIESQPHLVDGQTVEKVKLKPTIFTPPAQFQGKTLNEVKVANQNKVIALTFDDGPWPKYTAQILEILKKNNIKATFFWIGQNVKNYPELAQQVVAEGHAIGNHTWTHSYRRMNQTASAKEIEDTAAIIQSTTGVKTTLFRPPGGLLTNGPASYAISKNYAILMWSADSTDYARGLSVNTLYNRVMKNVLPGGMVLMHDGGGDRSRTTIALPRVIDALKKQGYRFVTVPELLKLADKPAKPAPTKPKQNVGTTKQGSAEVQDTVGVPSGPSSVTPTPTTENQNSETSPEMGNSQDLPQN